MKERVQEKYAWVILLALGLLWLVVGLYAVFLPEGIFSTDAQILRLSLIDAGIAICHILIAAGHQGKHVESIKDQEAARNTPSGKIYVTTLRIF